ncbi:hypothetical protein G7B40_036490 [Aetokthonos hydrillicola Thurmond2011]|uniref:Uncharacterized protein n=1 Tax=Aetokthonos hydrillicola Thurmond2011 TaxID=2712845 RepID=A0AAP5IF04_9CYAN|nr:hypothetical protein [Aetokthonos hydrillicola]MBO3457956.1 hypothetical protein [Aetokthonos hydrillicola CCALA 1050]MBW4587446.1 hypothetical protein [Aetokthonos hydrillicola CCALA 1050]MDR9900014.1 hypothetical protein [Aetokthonos hydrillicola Thurmond2011]
MVFTFCYIARFIPTYLFRVSGSFSPQTQSAIASSLPYDKCIFNFAQVLRCLSLVAQYMTNGNSSTNQECGNMMWVLGCKVPGGKVEAETAPY